MKTSKKANQKKGIIGTLLFHTMLIILLSLPFMSLTYQDPPLYKSQGININVNSTDNNQAETAQKENTEDPQKKNTEDPQKKNDNTKPPEEDQGQTQDDIVTTENDQAQLPDSLTSILDNSFNKASESNENKENTDSKKDQLTNDGSKEEEKKGSGINKGTASYQLDGRKLVDAGEKPKGNNKPGKVVIQIIVDENGTVISAKKLPGTELNGELITSSTDDILIKNAISSALQTTFSASSSKERQIGNIVFTFEVD